MYTDNYSLAAPIIKYKAMLSSFIKQKEEIEKKLRSLNLTISDLNEKIHFEEIANEIQTRR